MTVHLNTNVTTLVRAGGFRGSTTTTPGAPTKPTTKPEPKRTDPLPLPDDKPSPARPSPSHEPDDDPDGPNRCPGPCTYPP